MKNLLPVLIVVAAFFACLILDMNLHDGHATLLSYIPAALATLFVLVVVARSVYNWLQPLLPRLLAFSRTRAGFRLKMLLGIVALFVTVFLATSCQRVPPPPAITIVHWNSPVMVTDSLGWTGPKRIATR